MKLRKKHGFDNSLFDELKVTKVHAVLSIGHIFSF